MSFICHSLNPTSQFVFDSSSMLTPAAGDILLRKLTPESTVDYSLYVAPEDWSLNHKTWLLKVFSCPVTYSEGRVPPDGYPIRMRCLMLLVWEEGAGFTDSSGGGILIPDNHLSAPVGSDGSGSIEIAPDANCVAMAFVQPFRPEGPTFLRVDFWKEYYLRDEYSKLLVLSVVDSLFSTGEGVRTIKSMRKDGGGWTHGGEISAPVTIVSPDSVRELLYTELSLA